jgi:hypothetical protein
MTRYANGSLPRISGTFRSELGVLQDPDVVLLDVTTPAGVLTTYTSSGYTKAATGQYYKDLDANAVGLWTYRWYATGAGQSAESDTFYVY